MKKGFGQRIEQAILELSAERKERISLARFGELVGNAEVGRKKPYSATGVSAWIRERGEPGLRAFDAMEAVTGKPSYWFSYGLELQQQPTLPLGATESQKAKKGHRRG